MNTNFSNFIYIHKQVYTNITFIQRHHGQFGLRNEIY